MKCGTCVEAGTPSRVFGGMTMTTAMGFQSFWDEDGVRHHHDPNTNTTDYRCSNGHQWSDSTKAWCLVVGCEWNVRQHRVEPQR